MKHQQMKPSHIRSILTSKYYATEDKFIELAKTFKRCEMKEGLLKFLNPYKTKMRKRKDSDLDQNLKRETTEEVNGIVSPSNL